MKDHSLLPTDSQGLLTTPVLAVPRGTGFLPVGLVGAACYMGSHPRPVTSHAMPCHAIPSHPIPLGVPVPHWAQGKRTQKRTPGFPSGARVHHPDMGLRFHLLVTGKEQAYFLNIEI